MQDISYPFIGIYPLTWVHGYFKAADFGWIEQMTPWTTEAK